MVFRLQKIAFDFRRWTYPLGFRLWAFTVGPSTFGFCLDPLDYCLSACRLWLPALPFTLAGLCPFFAFWALHLYSIVGTPPLVLLVCYCACLCPRITPIRVTGCVGTMEGSGTCRDYIPLTPPPTNVRALLPATYY